MQSQSGCTAGTYPYGAADVVRGLMRHRLTTTRHSAVNLANYFRLRPFTSVQATASVTVYNFRPLSYNFRPHLVPHKTSFISFHA